MFAAIYLAAYLHTYLLSLYLPTCTSTHPTACRGSKSTTKHNPTEHLQILYLSICLPAYALACLNTYLPAYLSILLHTFLAKCQLICVPATCLTFVLPTCLYDIMVIRMLAYLLTCLPTCLPIYLLVSPTVCLPFAYLSTYVRTYPPSYLLKHLYTFHPHTYLHVYAPNYLPAYLMICLLTYLPAPLPDVLMHSLPTCLLR